MKKDKLELTKAEKKSKFVKRSNEKILKMRTHQEFRKQMQDAHDCEKCHGKLFCISKDNLGNSRCAYCNQIVKYPKATKEELAFWITMIEDKKLFEEMK